MLKAFSGDTLVKDETMGDWRVHTGTDYAAQSGMRVYAVSDGTVERDEVDAQYGGTVVINLDDGKQAVYQCLAEDLKVSAGDSVRAGDVIGTVGTIGYAESGQESHLHLELYANGEAIDPEQVLGASEETVAEEDIAVDVSQPQDGIYAKNSTAPNNKAFAGLSRTLRNPKRPLWGVFPQGCGRLVRPRP